MQRLVRVLEDFTHRFDRGVDVPMEAAHALVRGLDSPALAELAGMRRDRTLDVEDLIPLVLDELGATVAPRGTVVRRRAAESAAAYLDGAGFQERLSEVLWWFARYDEDGRGLRCCDTVPRLDAWLSSVECGGPPFEYGTAEAAEADFRAHCLAVVEGRACPPAPRR